MAPVSYKPKTQPPGKDLLYIDFYKGVYLDSQDLSGVNRELLYLKLYSYRYIVLELKFIFNKNIQNSMTYTVTIEIHPPSLPSNLHILEMNKMLLRLSQLK